MIIGYAYGQAPTYNDADVDQMYEGETSRLWEEVNAHDPNERKYHAAAGSLKKAIKALGKVLEHLETGVAEADGLPLSGKLDFFRNDFEDRLFDLKRMMDRAERGRED